VYTKAGLLSESAMSALPPVPGNGEKD
jgi:hypothetical protein